MGGGWRREGEEKVLEKYTCFRPKKFAYRSQKSDKSKADKKGVNLRRKRVQKTTTTTTTTMKSRKMGKTDGTTFFFGLPQPTVPR